MLLAEHGVARRGWPPAPSGEVEDRRPRAAAGPQRSRRRGHAPAPRQEEAVRLGGAHDAARAVHSVQVPPRGGACRRV